MAIPLQKEFFLEQLVAAVQEVKGSGRRRNLKE
jgi:hypothetical protein